MMDANQILSLGPLQIPVNWLILFAGLLIAVFITEKIARKRNWEKEKWSDLLLILFLSFLIVYKFGWILFDLKRVIQNPGIIIWTSGSTSSLWLAFILSALVLIYKIKKERYPIYDFFELSWLTLTITLFLYYLFIMDYGKVTSFIFGVSLEGESSYLYHPVNWYKAFWLALLLIIRFGIWSKLDENHLMLLYVAFGMGLLIISIFDVSMQLYFGLTVEQWFFLIIALIGGIGLLRKKRNE